MPGKTPWGYRGAGSGGRSISEKLREEAEKKKIPKPKHGKR